MGIDGLLRQLKDVVEQTHLHRFSDQNVVVDAFSWLHKACYGSAFELATGRETDAYVRYMLRKVELVKSCGIKDVILVFDGQRLPLKAATHEKRQGYKEENRKRAALAMQTSQRLQGEDRKTELEKAFQYFQKSVSITQDIVTNVMNALRAANIPFVVAPYEADAQMVWMCKEGYASAIITEDSDVFVYCMACNISTPVLFKLDDSGSVQALSRPILHKKTESSSNPFLNKIHFLTSGEKEATRMFVQFCTLSGCDFLDSLPNMGIVTALKHIFSFRGAPSHLRVQRILSKLASSGTKIPPEFSKRFVEAESIFFHHLIFDPKRKVCDFLIDGNHTNCFPDIFLRVRQSLGIYAEPHPREEISKDTHESTSVIDLHKTATKASSFLGAIQSAELLHQLYEGLVCSRSLQSFNSSQLTHSTTSNSSTQQSDDSSSEYGQTQRDDIMISHSTAMPATMVWKSVSVRTSQPESLDMRSETLSEQTALRQESQAQQRDATLQTLLSAYSQANSVDHSQCGQQRDLTHGSSVVGNLLNQVSSTPLMSKNGKRCHDKITSTAIGATPTSLKDLVAKHSISSALPTNTTPLKISPSSSHTPDSRKKLRVAAAKKAPLSGKKASTNGVTLLHFFEKK